MAEGIASQKTFPDKSAGRGSSLKTSSNKISPTIASLGKASLDKASFIEKSFSQYQIAVLDGPPNQMKVFACNEPARQAGIEIGMTKIQAEALPCVALRKRVLDHEFVAHAALLECGGKFSPRWNQPVRVR